MKRLSQWLHTCFVPHEGNDFKPHFLRRESMLVFFFLILIVELAFLAQVFFVFDKTKFLASVLPAVLSDLTNQERAENGVAPLIESSLLDKAAQAKADDMATNGYFAHTSPEGKTPWYWFNQVGYNYIYAGENLAVNFFESEDVAQAWMNSPTHRENIVKKDYTEIGIGVANGVYQGRSTVFVAQLFGKPLVIAPVVVEPEVTQSPASTPVVKVDTSKKVAVEPKPVTKPVVKPVIKPVVKPAPVTEPVVPVVQPVVTTNEPSSEFANSPTVTPVVIKVLGEETNATITPPVTNPTASQSPLRSFMQRVLSAPRTSVAYMYETLGLLILAALIIMFVRAELHHKKIMAEGFALIALILMFSFINLRIINVKTEVPTDDHNQITANVIDAFVIPQ